MPPLKFLFVAPRFHTNQIEWVRVLLEKQHQVAFHVTLKGPTEDYSNITPIIVGESVLSKLHQKAKKGGANKPYSYPSFVKYFFLFRKTNPDVVIIRDPKRIFSKIAAICARLHNKRIIFYTQEPLMRKWSFKKRVKKILYLKAFRAKWITPIIGDRSKEKLTNMFFLPLPVYVRNNFKSKTRTQDITILTTGKYHQERKKHLLLIKVIQELLKRHHIKLVIIGECVTKDQHSKFKVLQSYVKKHKLESVVKLLKNVPYCTMSKYYSESDIFVLPAVNEQYGISVSEAMGYALPVVCTDTCGARYHIKKGVNGFVVKSDSFSDLSRALSLMLTDTNKLNQLSASAHRYAQKELSGTIFYKEFMNIIDR